MGRGIALPLIALLVLGAAAPAFAQGCPNTRCESYAQSQIDNRVAQLNVTQNLLRLFLMNLSDNGRAIAYLSINSTNTSRHGLGVWEVVTAAMTDATRCPSCAQNFSTGLQYYGNNASSIYGNGNATLGRAALAYEQRQYLETGPKAGPFAAGITAVFRDAVLAYVEYQKAIFSSLGI